MLKAIAFDFDGIIVDTEIEWYHIYKDWLKKEYAYDLELSDYLVCVGSNSERLFSFIHKILGNDVPIEAFEQEALHKFIERTSVLPAMPGVEKLMKDCKKAGLKIAIATSAKLHKPYSHLNRLNLLQYVDVFSTAENSSRIKPYPDIYLKAAELCNCLPEECLAIEDSENGLKSAIAANMPCLIVPNKVTENSNFEGAYQITDSLEKVDINDLINTF